jgi:uncharacterized membrane protein
MSIVRPGDTDEEERPNSPPLQNAHEIEAAAFSYTAGRFHSGPLPPAELLREYAKLYPDAVRIIFEGYESQRIHRQAMEKKVIDTRCAAQDRGQWIGAALGLVGLIGCFTVILCGYPTAGTTMGTVVVLGLVGIFIYGRESQKDEREKKAEIAEKIKAGLSPDQDSSFDAEGQDS